jgi:hypothetical protein
MRLRNRSASVSALSGGVGGDDEKLLSAVAGEAIQAAQLLAHELGDGNQHAVSRDMPVVVVDILEVIDVEHDNR